MDFRIYPASLWPTFTYSTYSQDILDIFGQHAEVLVEYYRKNDREIEKWRVDSMERINNFAITQKDILRQDFNLQKGIFEEKRKENIEKAASYYRSVDRTSFDQLHIECESIEFKLAQIRSIKKEVEHLTVVSGMELESSEQQKEKGRLNIQPNNIQKQESTDSSYRRQENLYPNVDITATAANPPAQ